MNDKKTTYMVAVCLLVGTMLPMNFVVAGVDTDSPAKTVVTKAHTTRGDGEDPNIKSRKVVNDPAHPAPRPGKQRGEGEGCCLHVKSEVGWTVEVFLDKDYLATVPPYGTLDMCLMKKSHSLYAKAPGTGQAWGPATTQCESGEVFTWTIEYKAD